MFVALVVALKPILNASLILKNHRHREHERWKWRQLVSWSLTVWPKRHWNRSRRSPHLVRQRPCGQWESCHSHPVYGHPLSFDHCPPQLEARPEEAQAAETTQKRRKRLAPFLQPSRGQEVTSRIQGVAHAGMEGCFFSKGTSLIQTTESRANHAWTTVMSILSNHAEIWCVASYARNLILNEISAHLVQCFLSYGQFSPNFCGFFRI